MHLLLWGKDLKFKKHDGYLTLNRRIATIFSRAKRRIALDGVYGS